MLLGPCKNDQRSLLGICFICSLPSTALSLCSSLQSFALSLSVLQSTIDPCLQSSPTCYHFGSEVSVYNGLKIPQQSWDIKDQTFLGFPKEQPTLWFA